METAQEKDYLLPLFDEVLQNAKDKNPEFEDFDIEICMIDIMTVNACAIGKHTVAVTKGAMQTFSEDEMKAVLAHEVAHIIHSDTVARIYTLVGNGIFTFCILLIKLFFWVLGRLRAIEPAMRSADKLFDGVAFVFLFLMQIALSVRDRKAERRADNYTITLGYGESMVSALYLLEKISLGGEGSLIEKLLASHPRVTSRIEALEMQLGVQKGANGVTAGDNSGCTLGEIFDKLEGKTYGESWDILGSCSADIVANVARSSPSFNARTAAQAILDKNTGVSNPVKKSIAYAPIAIFAVVALALAAFFGPSIVSDIRETRGNDSGDAIATVNTTANPAAVPTETPASNENTHPTNAPSETSSLPVNISWNGVTYIATVSNFTPPSDTDAAINSLLNNKGEFGVYVLDANFSNADDDSSRQEAALKRFREKFGIDGDPCVLPNRWVKSLDGSDWPSRGVTVILSPPIDGDFPFGEASEDILKSGEQVIAVCEDGTIGVVTMRHIK
ncbi:hypothetical protein AGMMS49975_27340 [Clostridia bacterium]|nr:hypothetical protein AGMMS49975_27340 [Clostridia bacterium]